jgi:hypothetical protein
MHIHSCGKIPIVTTREEFRICVRPLGQAECRASTLEESIALLVFDVAMLAAAPSSPYICTLNLRGSVRRSRAGIAPLHGSTTSRQPSSPPPCLSLPLPLLLSTLAFCTRSPTHPASANAPDTDVGPPTLIPPTPTPTIAFSVLTLP